MRIFVIDDASTDRTQDLVLSYEAKYPGIIFPVLYKNNQYQIGGAPEFPLILNLNAKYLAFCDGDDYWTDKSKLEKQIAMFEKDPSLSIVHTDYFLGKEIQAQKVLERRTQKSQMKARAVKNGKDMVKGNEIKKSTALFRFENIEKSFLQKCHGIRAQDWLVAVSASLNGGISYLDEPTTFFRVSETASFQSLDQSARNRVKDEARWACAANLPDGDLRNEFRRFLFREFIRVNLRETSIYRFIRPFFQAFRRWRNFLISR
ncbi:Glycosyltransferase 2-like [Candidatus Nanopelagicaceae bacterium]